MAEPESAQKPGFWESALDEASAVAAGREFSQLQIHDQGGLYWVEYSPDKKGRSLICREPANRPGTVELLTPEDYSVQSRVHEYGGMSWCLISEQLIFVNADDQQLYLQSLDNPEQITPLTSHNDRRYIEPVWDQLRNRVLAVEEIHRPDGVENRLVAISLKDEDIVVLHQGYDFYAYPTLSSDASSLAFIAWSHPHQPWTSTQLLKLRFTEDGEVESASVVAGEQEPESLSQPLYTEKDELYVVSDRDDYWNIYQVNAVSGQLTAVSATQTDLIPSPWQCGIRHYGFMDDQLVVISLLHEGAQLMIGCSVVESGFNHFKSLAIRKNKLALVAASPDRLPAVLFKELQQNFRIVVGGESPLAERDCSKPEAKQFGSGETQCYGYLYPPANCAYELGLNERPPLVIFLHGGPTAATYPILNLKIQYWTQRGFSVLDLNYRGSSNYGRNYRSQLKGRWGEVEIEDIRQAVIELIASRTINPSAIFIRGNSSGGYTALNALCELDCFAAGASLYGVTDPEVLDQCTHKFESYYLHWLIGDPVRNRDRYRAYAPIHKANQITAPVIFFQGEKDRVVLPDQTRTMVKQLQVRGISVEAHYFSDEGHGFRQAGNAELVLKSELSFYRAQL